MDARIVGHNPQGGRIIEVFLPISVVEEAQEITELVEEGSLHEETTARERWLSRVQPHIDRALKGLETNWALDQIALRAAESVSTLKRPTRVVLPSTAPVASLNRAQRRAFSSRPPQ